MRGGGRRTPTRGPTHPHHIPRPYDATMPVLPVYSRGERGVVVGWMALVVARPPLYIEHSPYLNGIGPLWSPGNITTARNSGTIMLAN